MYGPPGHAYVYFTYGMHWMLNFVAEPEGFPAAVLIRAILPTEGLDVIAARRDSQPFERWTDGPAARALGIDGGTWPDSGGPKRRFRRTWRACP
jgi:DNA-3-methyladenine glycosylase